MLIIDTDSEAPPPQFQIIPELLSGMLAGMLTCVAFYPLECMEARLQVFAQQKGGPGESKAKLGYVKGREEKEGIEDLYLKFYRLVGIAKQMLAQEGVSAFYKGLLPTLLGSAINWGLYFGIYEYQNNAWYVLFSFSPLLLLCRIGISVKETGK